LNFDGEREVDDGDLLLTFVGLILKLDGFVTIFSG